MAKIAIAARMVGLEHYGAFSFGGVRSCGEWEVEPEVVFSQSCDMYKTNDRRSDIFVLFALRQQQRTMLDS